MEHPVKTFRLTKGLTLEGFGALVGVKKSAVSKWERGLKPSIRTAIAIEEATEGAVRKEQLRPEVWAGTSGAA